MCGLSNSLSNITGRTKSQNFKNTLTGGLSDFVGKDRKPLTIGNVLDPGAIGTASKNKYTRMLPAIASIIYGGYGLYGAGAAGAGAGAGVGAGEAGIGAGEAAGSGVLADTAATGAIDYGAYGGADLAGGGVLADTAGGIGTGAGGAGTVAGLGAGGAGDVAGLGAGGAGAGGFSDTAGGFSGGGDFGSSSMGASGGSFPSSTGVGDAGFYGGDTPGGAIDPYTGELTQPSPYNYTPNNPPSAATGGKGLFGTNITPANIGQGIQIGGALRGLVQSQQQQRMADAAAKTKQGYQDQIADLSNNPDKVSNLPGYQFGLKSGNQALQRQLAAQGRTGSGGELAALKQFNQAYAGDYLNREQQRLASLAGMNWNTGMGYQGASNLQNSSFNGLAYWAANQGWGQNKNPNQDKNPNQGWGS